MKPRVRITNKKRFVVFIALIITIASTLVLTSQVYGYKDISYKTITVRKGDTLWNIAAKYGSKDKDIRRTIYEIQKLNNLSSSCLYEGDEILIAVR